MVSIFINCMLYAGIGMLAVAVIVWVLMAMIWIASKFVIGMSKFCLLLKGTYGKVLWKARH